MTKRYAIHAAAIDAGGIRLSPSCVRARTLKTALALAARRENHGPDGAAIVCPSGRVIYSRDEYDAAYARAAKPEGLSGDELMLMHLLDAR